MIFERAIDFPVSQDLASVIVVAGFRFWPQHRFIDQLSLLTMEHSDGTGVDHAPDAGSVCAVEQLARSFHIDPEQFFPVTSSLEAVAEERRRVKQYVARCELRRKTVLVCHIPDDNFNGKTGKLFLRLLTGARKGFDSHSARDQQAHQVVAEQPGGSCNERCLNFGICLRLHHHLCSCSETHPLKTIAGSIRVTLLIETNAAPTHISSVRKNMPTAMGGGIRIAAPPF